jgi:hypothetical protein
MFEVNGGKREQCADKEMLVLDEGTNKRLENLRNEDPVICNIT